MIAVSGGFKALSDIRDIERELKDSGLYTNLYVGDHELYVPEKGEYCIKKSTLWLDSADDIEDFKNTATITSGHRIMAIRDVTAVLANNGMNKYNVFMCIDKADTFDSEDPKRLLTVCGHLCDILSAFYNTSKRYHNNINHRNVFKSGDDVILGNCSLAGEKNEIPYYNAPEILRGERASERTDVYSLGMWLYCKLRSSSGGNVFASNDRYGIKDENITFRSDIDKKTVAIIKKAISIDPKDRYSSPAEMKSAIVKALKPVTTFKWKPVLIVASAVLIVGALAAYFITSFFNTYDPGADEIRSMISSGSYSLAYSEISRRDRSPDTDALIMEYIDGCMDVLDYKRAAQIIPLFSDQMFDSPDYIESLIYEFRSKDKMNLLEDVFSEIYTKSDAIAEIIDKLN